MNEHIVTTAGLAELLGVSEPTVREWTEKEQSLRLCIIRATRKSTWYSIQKLRDAKWLSTPVYSQGEVANA